MTTTAEVSVYKFVEPDAELPEGAEVIEDDAAIKAQRLHYEAMQWAIDNRGAVLYINAFLPSLQMPVQRAMFYEGTAGLLETCAADIQDNGPTEARSKLVKVTETVEIPEEPRVIASTEAAPVAPTLEGKDGGFGLIVPGR